MDTELRGVRVKKGDRAAMFYPSANRDETRFADPDRFDVSRTPNPHVAFGGGGTHFCLGANLARVEATALVSEVLSRMKNLELAGPVERMPSTLINGIHSVPVRFTPCSTARVMGDRAGLRCSGTATAPGVQQRWPGQSRSRRLRDQRRAWVWNEARLTR